MSNLQSCLDSIDDFVRAKMQAARTPGLVLALTDGAATMRVTPLGRCDLESGAEVTAATRFEIGSIGKCFTAIALVQSAEAGELDLQAPVTDYLPWLEFGSSQIPISIHHLLTHTAGLPEGFDFSPDALAEVWALRLLEPGAPPGTHFHYSNVGYKILGLVLEAVVGRPYPEVIAKRILDPCGMADTTAVITHAVRPSLARGYQSLYDDRPFHPDYPLVPAAWVETDTGDGSIVSTAEDMARFGRVLLNRGRTAGGQLLSTAGFDRLTQPVIAGDEDWHYAYGLVVFEEDGCAHIAHGGDMPGYEASLRLDLTSGLGLVLMMTTPAVRGIPAPVMQMLRAVRQGRPAEPLPAIPDPHEIDDAAALAGTYRMGDDYFTLTAADGGLYMERGGEKIQLENGGGGCVHVPSPDFDRFPLRFGRVPVGEGEPAGPVVEAFHGPHWYVGECHAGPEDFTTPPSWPTFCGHYRAHNPWLSNFRVVLRKDRLIMIDATGEEETLTPLGAAEFRLGDELLSPERLCFDWVSEGRALRANLSGGYYYRFFTQ